MSDRTKKFFETSDRILWAGVISLLVLPTIFFAAVDPISEAFVVTACFLLGAVLAWQVTAAGDLHRESRRLNAHRFRLGLPLVLCAGVILFWGWLAGVPLPSRLLGALSPAAAELRRAAGEAARTGVEGSFPLSLHSAAGSWAMLKLAALLIFFLVCLRGFFDWRRNRLAVAVAVSTVFIVSVLGTVQSLALTSGRRILWASWAREGLSPFGPFINRNHFAAWAGMGGLLGLGWFLSLRRKAVKTTPEGDAPKVWHDRNFTARRALVGFMTAMIMAAVLISLSRGGILSLIFGLAVTSFLMGTKARRGHGWRMVGVICLALLAVTWIGAGPLMARLGTLVHLEDDVSASIRADLNRDLLRMVADFPWTGTGPGTFGDVYPAYRTTEPKLEFAYAHNDWLQLLAEWGAIGFILCIAAACVFWWAFLKNWNRRHSGEVLSLSAGAAGAVAAMMAHSLVDFNLHITADALLLLFTAAVALKGTAALPEARDDGGERHKRRISGSA